MKSYCIPVTNLYFVLCSNKHIIYKQLIGILNFNITEINPFKKSTHWKLSKLNFLPKFTTSFSLWWKFFSATIMLLKHLWNADIWISSCSSLSLEIVQQLLAWKMNSWNCAESNDSAEVQKTLLAQLRDFPTVILYDFIERGTHISLSLVWMW